MKHTGLPMLVALTLVACGDTPIDDEETPEVGSCAIVLADEAATVAEGARTQLELVVEGDVSELSVMTSVGVASVEDATLVIKTPYGSAGQTAALTLNYTCGGETQQLTSNHTVRTIAWTQMPSWTPGVDGPLSREYGTMWIDEVDPDRLLAFGGFHYQPQQFTPANEFWEYDFTTESWGQLSPVDAPARPGGGLALIGNQQAIYFGGLFGDATPYSVERIDYASDAPVFTTIAGSSGGLGGLGQVGDYQPALFFDEARGRLISACGVNATWGYHCRVRSMDPATGEMAELQTTGGGPVGRNGHFWVHDAETERLIVFSGDSGNGGAECDCLQDTWALELAEEPMRWVQLATAEPAPEGRRNGAYVLDREGHRMLIWGGTPDGASTAPGLWALDLDRGEERWQLVQPWSESPPERTSSHGVYDAARQRLVVGFGNGEHGVHTDLWSLSL